MKLFAVIAVTWSFLLSVDGFGGTIDWELDQVSPYISNGTQISIQSRPYQVSLVIDFVNYCSGILLSDLFVLTAAHCIYGRKYAQVILGANNPNASIREPTLVSREALLLYPHDLYRPNSTRFDIGVVRFPSPVTFTDVIKPVTLPNMNDTSPSNYTGEIGIVSGWGYNEKSGPMAAHLRGVNVTVITNYECNASYSGVIRDEHLCASGRGAACIGDGGGPLIFNHTLIGLISWSDEACNMTAPTVFSRITYWRDWIYRFSGI
ncbi:brachyurin-like [Cylas formicarius]|uniref:brachyurin-like n=1 Tax=Cylas formicarius TaxID=197179 RepID=UPI002958B8CC|nr:brachyurin-like [Cylas formicarius]